MEVLYRTQPIFGAQPAAMVYPSTSCPALSPPSPMFAAPSQPYTCYPFQVSPPTHSPSRTPTPEYADRSRSSSSSSSSGVGGQEGLVSEGTTLKSVLRGEVPEAYSHFLSSSSSSSFSPSSSALSSSSGYGSGSNSSSSSSMERRSPLGKRKCPFVEVEPSCSPAFLGLGRVAASSSSSTTTTVLSPPPEDVQTEPMDLSFKRPSSTTSSSDEAASSSSSPASFHHTFFPPSPAEDHQGQSGEFSLLRNLLQVGKLPLPLSSPSHSTSSINATATPTITAATSSSSSSSASDRSCDSPCSSESGFPTRHLCGSTRVTLAKKNMYPVSARVSDWLVKVVQFARSVQCFREELTPDDQLTLLLSAWSRLLLLFMAESNFQFVVTPLRSEPEPDPADGGAEGLPSPDEPTMKSVEAIQTFIRKCQHMGVEGEEYRYLRMLVLFNSGNVGVSDSAKVDSFNSQIQKSLQMHVHHTRPRDVMHYSRLLMCLPSLYGISSSMVERLFCKHMDKSSSGPADLTTVLRDLMRSNMDR